MRTGRSIHRPLTSCMLLQKAMRVVLRHKLLLFSACFPNILMAGLDPVQAWLAKNVLNRVSRGETVFALRDLLPYAWLSLGVFLGLGFIRLGEKVANRMFDDRMLIELQREWFQHCSGSCAGERVARTINDCESARKIYDLVQRDLWMGIVGLPAVFIWQMSLEPRWVPALLMAAIPPFCVALFFGGGIQKGSLLILRFVTEVSKAVVAGDRAELFAKQEGFYRQRVKLEFYKQSSETLVELSRWPGVALVLALSGIGVWQVAPARVGAGEIGVFLVNLALLIKPLMELTKLHNKIREGWPALRRIFEPETPNLEESEG